MRPFSCKTFRREEWASFLYCYGNSLPEDVFQNHSPASESLSTLFLGCGDIRNLLFTLSEAFRKGSKAQYSFTLNDWAPEVIARNALLLFALDADPSLPTDHLVQLMYSLEFSEEVYQYWILKVKECLSVDNWESHALVRFQDEKSREAVKFVWSRWLEFNWSKSELKKNRLLFLKKQNAFKKDSLDSQMKNIAQTYVLFMLGSRMSEPIKKDLEAECFSVLKHGSFEPNQPRLNPTLHLVRPDGSFAYALHYGSNPFEGHPINPDLGLKKSVQLNLGLWIRAFRSIKSQLKSVTLCLGHALQVTDELILDKNSEKYDVIETSNLADHVGQLNLLVNGSVLLKDSPSSFIKTCSFLIYTFANDRDEYLDIVTGMPKTAYPTLLGLELVDVDEAAWDSNIQPFAPAVSKLTVTSGRNYEFFVWKKAPCPPIPLSLTDSPFLVSSLVRNAEKTSVSGYHKPDGPGASNTTPSLFPKMLAFAFAQQRITVSNETAKANASLPFPAPESLWESLLNSSNLLGTMSELFAYANLYGFKSKNPEINAPPMLVQGVFPTPKHPDCPTPSVTLNIQTGPAHHAIDSVHMEELSGDRVQLTFYVPGFIDNWDPETITVHLFAGAPTLLGPQVRPMGPPIPFSELKVVRIKDFDLMDLTAAVLRTPKQELSKSVTVAQIRQPVEAQYEIKLDLADDFKDAKVGLLENGPGKSLTGLTVGNDVVPIQFPASRVKLVSCKVFRKSGYILLTVKSLQCEPPAPQLSLNKLPKMTGRCPQALLGAMFTDEHQVIQSGLRPVASFPLQSQILYGLKENMMHIFNDIGVIPFMMLTTQALGIIGCVFYHGAYMHPPTDSSFTQTPMLDASFAFFELKDIDIAKAIMALENRTKQLTLDEKEVEPMKQLFNAFHVNSMDKSDHPAIVALGAQHVFKRCIVHPLYPRKLAPLMDEGKKNRDALKAAQQKSMGMASALKSGDLDAVSNILESMNMDSDKMEQLKALMGMMGMGR